MLRVWLNSKLWWNEHVKVVLDKMKTQINTLVHITAFIWSIIFASTWQIYSAIIRSALAHEAVIWHSLQSEKQRDKKMSLKDSAVRMTSIQNKCLWIVSEVYHAISISVLKTETFTSSLNLYLNTRLTQFWLRHKESDMKNLIKNACFKICNKLQKRRYQIADSCIDQVNIRSLISSWERMCKLIRWFIQLQILLQFNLTEKLLYKSKERKIK